MKSIYWFKRDLRIFDNRALIQCLSDSNEVYSIFIFDDNILNNLKAFDNRLYFLKIAVDDLNRKIPLKIFYGQTEKIIEYLLEELRPDSLYTAISLTWEGEERTSKVRNICQKRGVKFVEVFDNFLVDPRKIEFRRVFSHFLRKWLVSVDDKILDVDENLLRKFKLIKTDKFQIPEKIKNIKVNKNFYWSLEFLNERISNFNFREYDRTRNLLAIDGTSKLSPYIRFGLISIRYLFHLAKRENGSFLVELAWREFWYHIKHYFPQLRNLEFQERRRNLSWQNNERLIRAFEEGKTGYPIVDAAIRQLTTENWMHNRARMIVGSFLTKDLLADWRIGEKFFSRYLIDYDEVVNTGNWQWVASVGPDPKPLRIFNPIIQAKKFDPQAKYILKYLPELRNEKLENILDPFKGNLKYIKPIVNHREIISKIKELYNV
ncbi:MAG: DNA photolyase family protein [Patescibacteria group bacterium]|nr:DNA photolyase family protein [Patescibacteria group bacterium]